MCVFMIFCAVVIYIAGCGLDSDGLCWLSVIPSALAILWLMLIGG